jgi:hypothetical protein
MIREYVILTGYLYSASMALFLFLNWIVCVAHGGSLIITIGDEWTIELMLLSWLTVVSFWGLVKVFKLYLDHKLG